MGISGDKSVGREIAPLVDGETVVVRQAKQSDLPEIMSIERASFSSPWSAKFFLEELRAPQARSLLAQAKDKIIGYIIYWQLPNEVDIHNVAVHPAYRRMGIGRMLLQFTVEQAQTGHSNRVTLEVRKSNRGAQRLYKSLGFVVCGIREGYYSDNGEDALVMVLEQ